jgi:hypothetical protein
MSKCDLSRNKSFMSTYKKTVYTWLTPYNVYKLIEVLFTIHKNYTFDETWHTLLNN